jgi:hypothetical protein
MRWLSQANKPSQQFSKGFFAAQSITRSGRKNVKLKKMDWHGTVLGRRSEAAPIPFPYVDVNYRKPFD